MKNALKTIVSNRYTFWTWAWMILAIIGLIFNFETAAVIGSIVISTMFQLTGEIISEVRKSKAGESE